MITSQYNQMLWMAQTLRGIWRASELSPRRGSCPSATNTYGTTAGWIAAINTLECSRRIPNAIEQLLPYGAALGNVPADQLSRLQKTLRDHRTDRWAEPDGMETVATLRSNAPQVETPSAISRRVAHPDPDYNTEIAVLNKINAASVIAMRNSQTPTSC